MAEKTLGLVGLAETHVIFFWPQVHRLSFYRTNITSIHIATSVSQRLNILCIRFKK